jgi:hypothetical protein
MVETHGAEAGGDGAAKPKQERAVRRAQGGPVFHDGIPGVNA